MSTATTELAGKVAIVTGAASGIGAATAQVFVAAGAQVVLVDRDASRLAAVAQQLGSAASALVVDVTADDAPQQVIEHTLTTFGQLDIVVNSAGVLATEPVGAITRDSYDRIMGVNVRGPFFLTQAAVAHLSAGASIIFVASGNAVLASPSGSIYATSKGALVSLVKGLTADLAPRGIRTNAISPGPIRTPLLDAALADDSVRAALEGGVPAGRLGTAAEVAAVALFLASDASSYLYGSNIAVDGGTTSVWSPAAPGNDS